MMIKKFVFEKHKYVVRCKCGRETTNNDDGVVQECELVKISWCSRCCQGCAGIPIQLLFTADGERICT